MKLKEYLKINKISIRNFARSINSKSHNSVFEYISDKVVPRPNVMQRIYEVTGGIVTPYDFLKIPTENCKGFTFKSKDDENYFARLSQIQSFNKKYRKSVKQKNLIEVICNDGEYLTLQSLNSKMTGKTKFTNFEIQRILNFYNKLERRNKWNDEKLLKRIMI